MALLYCWIVILIIIGLVEAKPICTNTSFDQVSCVPGNYSQVVLRKGMVSENNFTKLLSLTSCRISDVDFEAFDGVPALLELDLSQNMISYLQLGVLDEFKQLTHLNLSFNYIRNFPLGLFDQKPNLISLDLGSNKLQALELGIFDPLTKLEYLDISWNSLIGSEISPYIFDINRRIKTLKLSGNNMNEAKENLLHSLTMLQVLALEDCKLDVFPPFALQRSMKKLLRLDLSLNKIRQISNDLSFENLTSLISLHLTSNVIEDIGENVFKPLKKIKVLVFRNNRIKDIPDTLFQNIPVTFVDLANNIIEYIPVNAFRGTKLRNFNIASNRITYLQDNFCLELRNSGAVLTKFYFNDNPWQCACLRDVLNEVKKFGVTYNDKKYDGKHPVCVVPDDFVCHRHLQYNENVYKIFDSR
ncbi:carboxypeptidase N subunit 2 [Pieris rapae]|uniref:carboxypeptidase N subunit 2 n=1 Tax=Pieris rapae TaxID=64459 RepID=UPI001E27DFDA|nr:carboxypeptidase N subunit 2 [Pieris rapae]